MRIMYAVCGHFSSLTMCLLCSVKAFVYAFLLTSISCYQGYNVKGGSVELGVASTNAVVFSDIAILLADYIITIILTS